MSISTLNANNTNTMPSRWPSWTYMLRETASFLCAITISLVARHVFLGFFSLGILYAFFLPDGAAHVLKRASHLCTTNIPSVCTIALLAPIMTAATASFLIGISTFQYVSTIARVLNIPIEPMS